MSVTKRLKQFIDYKGFSGTEFSETIGISQTTLSNQFRSVKGVGLETITHTLERFNELSVEWLMIGKGEMLVADNLPAFDGDESENDLNTHAKLAKLEVEKDALIQRVNELEDEIKKKDGYIEGQQDFISKLIIENDILKKELGKKEKKDIV